MPDNVFAGLDEIIERQKKAEQDAEKHTNDILSALSNTNSINATVDIDITKATNAACESIVKNATRVWRYHGEKSDFRRETNKIKKRGIILIIILLIQIALPFFLIAKPHYWIFATINAGVCAGYGVYSGYRFFRKRKYEEPYGRKCEFWQRNDYDDNGIAIITEDKLLFKLFKILTLIILPIISIVLFISSDLFPLQLIFSILLGASVPIATTLESGLGYILYFIYGDNQVPYDHLKGFMKKNNLK